MSVSDLAMALKNLAAASFRFDVTQPYLQVTFSVLTASDECGVQGDRDRRRPRFRLDRGAIAKGRAGPQGVATHGLLVFADTNREHLLQYIGGGPIGHQGGEARLKSAQLRR
jgi:hypothetical protein